jgi:diguanylate cyclase (GGDEF)-like protein/PAS domain S-box-containing protein
VFAHQRVEQTAIEKAVLRALVVSSPDPVTLFRVDPDGYRHVYVDPRLCEPRGVTRDDVEGLTIRETYSPRAAAAFEARAQLALTGEVAQRFAQTTRVGAETVDIEFTMSPLVFDDVRYLVVHVRDVSDRSTQVAAVTASDERLRALLEHAPDMVLLTDRDARVVYATPAAQRILGYSPDEIVGLHTSSLVHPDDLSSVSGFFAQVLRLPATPLAIEFRTLHRNGTERYTDCTVTNLLSDPRIAAIVVNAYDVTEHRRTADELAYRAHHDDLTGLPNRRFVTDRLNDLLAITLAPGETAAVLFLDIDGFKIVNDSRGHAAGDELLRAVAARLRAAVGTQACVGRVGGDEFVIVPKSPGTIGEHLALAEIVRESIADPFVIARAPHFLSGSVGVATGSPACGSLAADLLVEADLAMYTAKKHRDAVCLFDQSMRADARNRLETATDLRNLLERDELELYYQPVRRSATGRIASVEGLLRWHHPTRGLIMPDDFITVAEETGAILGIGDWVVEQMCRQLARWNEQGRRLSGAVNVSPHQIVDPGFLERTTASIARAGIDPRQLVVEVTEGSIMEDSAHIRGVLHGFTEIGVRLAIDDFGRGFSSLAYLNRLPAAILKIDRVFTSGLDRPDAADGHVNRGRIGSADPITLFRSIVAMAHSLGLDVVAEGVETEGQLAIVRSTGCAYAQGFLLGRPVPIDEFDAMLFDQLADQAR